MFCTKCGAQFEGNFCTKCGTPVSLQSTENGTSQQPPVSPVPPARPTMPKKKGGCLKVALIVFAALIALVILIGVLSGGNEDSASVAAPAGNLSSAASKSNQSASEASEKTYGIGEAAELKGVSITLESVEENKGSQFNTPTEGNIFVLLEFTIENNSKEELAISSMMSFDAYCDDFATSVSLGATIERGDKNQLDGTIAPGKKMNGIIGYELPADWSTIETRFQPSILSGGKLTFLHSKAK